MFEKTVSNRNALVRAYSSKTQGSSNHHSTTRHRHHLNEEASLHLSHAQPTIPLPVPPPSLRATRRVYLAPSLTPPPPTLWLQYVHPPFCIDFWPCTDRPQQAPNQPRPYPGNYLPNGGPNSAPSGPAPGAVPLLPNQGRVIQQGSVRVLCIADVRGKTASLETRGPARRLTPAQETCNRSTSSPQTPAQTTSSTPATLASMTTAR
jgi:hypothetical protein